MAMVCDGEGLFPGKWHEHVQAWNANPYGAEKIVIKYEDLKKDALTELTRFCVFAHLERDQTFLQRVIDQTEFTKMQAKEKEGRITSANKTWPPDRHFFRRGVVESYRDEMSSDVLDAFLQDAGAMLRELGYAQLNNAFTDTNFIQEAQSPAREFNQTKRLEKLSVSEFRVFSQQQKLTINRSLVSGTL